MGPMAGPLWSSFMVSPTDVWAVGQNQTYGSNGRGWCLLALDGTAGLGGGWNTPQATVNSGPIYSVFLVSPTEGWAVGANGTIFHYFGGIWNSFVSPVKASLRPVFMISPTEGWAVGDGGVIIHFSTGIWTGPVSPGRFEQSVFSLHDQFNRGLGLWCKGSNSSLLWGNLDVVTVKLGSHISRLVVEFQFRVLQLT